jgi:phosphate transport system permease protein
MSVNRSAVEASASWRLTDRLGLAFAWLLGILFCAICAAIVIYLAVEGIHYLRPDMLWTNPKVSTGGNSTGGFLAPILGTLIVTALALLIAVPLGVWVAVWLTEYGRPRALARVVESTTEMLAAMPSVVLALFGLVIFEAPILGFLSQINQGIVYGKSFFAAGAMLSLLALPFVVVGTRAGLQSIPNHVREASYALGKSKIATIRRVLLPASRPSIVAGSSIGAGHVIGDTAIIVMLGGGTYTLQSAGGLPILGLLRGTFLTLTSYVYDNAPTGELNHPQQAFAGAVVLIGLVLIVNLIVEVFARKSRDLKWS